MKLAQVIQILKTEVETLADAMDAEEDYSHVDPAEKAGAVKAIEDLLAMMQARTDLSKAEQKGYLASFAAMGSSLFPFV